ncbi:hypothetical protein CCMSSC00406_0004870 [Pleurotus cornucopiae]|uniref:Uncharacterized protein n=1 Tax=Pleurotus cornucopiae TaxID=5321 RepID=A0ACB7J198_PLECO|nr:hypothetical protein CCMSSC00406_0004870 [Pleurotus cornucopiae]
MMVKSTSAFAVLLQVVSVLHHVDASPTPSLTAAKSDVSVKVRGQTFINKGVVGFGLIPSDFRESTGDTLGGIGSAMTLKLGTWAKTSSGTYTGTLVMHPDRGFNVDGTVDVQGRRHEIDFVLTPYTDKKKLSFKDAQKTLQLTYRRSILETERGDAPTSGLDPLAVRPPQSGFPSIATADPEMPIASNAEPHLTVDAEGIVANADGSFWVSDEYGPYIYRYSSEGKLLQTIQPPEAILPHDAAGFEGLTLDTMSSTLYAMLQTATIQDGGADKTTSRFTRLFAFDVLSTTARPSLIGEWVVPLPQSKNDKTRGCSEIIFVGPNLFLALARDGNGRGDDDIDASYKHADLVDISQATNIRGSKFDNPANPVAPGGKLDKSVTPATLTEFVDFIDKDQLARFGEPNDETLIDAKWESFTLAPVDDPVFPNDYFLFIASDNDFISTHGISLGQPFNAGLDVDNQWIVVRVTLPTVAPCSIQARTHSPSTVISEDGVTDAVALPDTRADLLMIGKTGVDSEVDKHARTLKYER